MSAGNILNIFQPGLPDETIQVSSFDWSKHSIDCVYVIFITGRCGSTWLTHLLEDSGMCGHPHELFNETMMPRFNRTVNAGNFGDYFRGAVANFSSAGRFGFKIDEYRFRHFLGLVDFSSVFPAPATKFFWMTRTDVVDQAFSYARAKTTGHWHDFTSNPLQPQNGDVQLSDLQLWKEIFDIIGKENRMRDFFEGQGIVPIKLNYEQMTADRYLTVMNVMLELQCPPDEIDAFLQRMEDKTLKLEFGNKYRILGQFCARYKRQLHEIQEHRAEVDVEELKRVLRLDFALAL